MIRKQGEAVGIFAQNPLSQSVFSPIQGGYREELGGILDRSIRTQQNLYIGHHEMNSYNDRRWEDDRKVN